MNKDFFIKQLDDILSDFNKIKSKAQYDDLSGNVISLQRLPKGTLLFEC